MQLCAAASPAQAARARARRESVSVALARFLARRVAERARSARASYESGVVCRAPQRLQRGTRAPAQAETWAKRPLYCDTRGGVDSAAHKGVPATQIDRRFQLRPQFT